MLISSFTCSISTGVSKETSGISGDVDFTETLHKLSSLNNRIIIQRYLTCILS